MAAVSIAALSLSASVSAAHASEEAGQFSWPAVCAALDETSLVNSEASKTYRTVVARDCALALEKQLGPDDRRLANLYAEIAEKLAAGRGGAAARAALPYRRRAHRSAERLHGAASETAGRAALDYARASILAGRCEAHDPEVLTLLDSAAIGMRAAGAQARLTGLRAVASGYADGLAYKRAAATLLEAGGPEGAALRPEDWERIGLWRHRVADLTGAEQAYRRALALDAGPRDRLRLRQSLKQVLFERGDLPGLRSLGE